MCVVDECTEERVGDLRFVNRKGRKRNPFQHQHLFGIALLRERVAVRIFAAAETRHGRLEYGEQR